MSTRDEGFALVFTMGAIALITAVAIGGYVLAEQTLNDSVRGGNYNRAYQIAAAGLEQEISFFSPERLSDYDGGKPVNMAGGMYTAWVNPPGEPVGAGEYVLLIEGQSEGITETVLTRFHYLNLWDMNISGGGESSVGVKNGFNGNSTIIGSLYVNGDMDWGSNGEMWGGPIFVNDGEWNSSGSASVGSATDRVDAYGPVPSDNTNYFTNLKGSAPALEVPQLSNENMDQYLEGAQLYATNNPRKLPLTGVQPANQDATYYTVFNGDTRIGADDFGDTTQDAISVKTVGATTALYLKENAVIFIDGTCTLDERLDGYLGAGMIIATEGFDIEGNVVPLNGLTETLYGYTLPKMDATNCLGLLTQGNVTSTKNADWVCAAVFMNGNYVVPSSAHNSFRGSMICNSIMIDTTGTLLANQPGLGEMLPEGMPELAGFTARGDWVRR